MPFFKESSIFFSRSHIFHTWMSAGKVRVLRLGYKKRYSLHLAKEKASREQTPSIVKYFCGGGK